MRSVEIVGMETVRKHALEFHFYPDKNIFRADIDGRPLCDEAGFDMDFSSLANARVAAYAQLGIRVTIEPVLTVPPADKSGRWIAAGAVLTALLLGALARIWYVVSHGL